MKYFNLELLSHRIYYLPLGHDMSKGTEWDGTGREEKKVLDRQKDIQTTEIDSTVLARFLSFSIYESRQVVETNIWTGLECPASSFSSRG